jgi:hypothetical protein
MVIAVARGLDVVQRTPIRRKLAVAPKGDTRRFGFGLKLPEASAA